MGTQLGVKPCRCCLLGPKGEQITPRKKLLTRALESFYDNCAAYNLRYIPYRTLTDQTCVQTIVKDFVLLFCFFVTNFVVFLTILARIAMHLCDLFFEAFDWMKEMSKSPEKPPQKKMLTHISPQEDCPNFCRNPRNRQHVVVSH
ncbi:uncharacterized protein LOC125240524 [Leguminivora glycinivorella]|uniref:uncharacterized protein LOC125240524 n=1 Tax=Leguminivora glycinivorella TaxID=1035111 RepID=UPI00200CD581|nr:uncharacterized protein LOC125240524 [Leguminivora glycinivorella]